MLGLLKAIMDWAGKHPLLAMAIAIDLVLLTGCWWGYRQHVTLQKRDAQIVVLNKTVKDDNSFITLLTKRIKEYATALTQSQDELARTIADNNKAIDRLKKAADAQLAAAQKQAEQAKRQRDYYAALALEQQQPTDRSGTADQRIAREQARNRDFIKAFRKV